MNPRYPIMAALLAASLGTVSLGTSHATSPCPEVDASEKNPVNIIAGIICRDDKAKADVGERFANLVLMMDGTKPRFVSEDISKDEAGRTRVAGAAKKWPTLTLVTPAQVADLYYVMGDGAPPSWVTGNAILKDKVKAATNAEADRRKGLVPALEIWRDANQGRIGWVKLEDNTGLFLKHAAEAARAILSDPRTRPDLELSIDQNDSAPVVPLVPGRRASDLTPFDGAYMYANGGKLGSFKNSAGLPVHYNIKLETTKNSAGELMTNIVVHDLAQGYSQRFPITATGEQAFSLGSPQHRWPMVLDIKPGEGGDLAISLRLPADKEGKEAIKTTANALAQARLDQAVTAGHVVDIGGKSFYISGQGGPDGAYLYYPTALANRTGAAWSNLRPEHMAVIAKVGNDGLYVPVDASPDIGKINGKPYKLEYNPGTGRWKPVEGQGTMPPKEAAPAATSTPGSDADRATNAASADKWVLDSATDGLSAATKEKGYRILSQPNPKDTTQMFYNVLTPVGFADGNSITFAGVTNLRAFSHYITWQRGGEYAYQDLLVKTSIVNDAGEKRENFEMVGRVSGGVFSSVDNSTMGDHDMLMDALKVHAKMTDAQLKTTLDNVKTVAGSNRYSVIRASDAKVIIQVPSGKKMSVYPAVAEEVDPGANPPTPGTGTAVDLPTGPGGEDVPFLESIDFDAHMKLTLEKMDGDNPATASAALYVKKTQEADKQWFLYVKYREDVPATATAPASRAVRRSNHILVFSNVATDNRMTLPDITKLFVKGQTGYDGTIDPKIVSVSRVDGSTPERGAWTLHKAPSSQVGPKNCVGPVVWWGVTEAEAKEAGCVKAKFE